jgi:hypothetical protein
MPGLVATSIAAEAGWPIEAPSTASVERAAGIFAAALERHLAVRATVREDR